jgi:hypothetical protein
VAFAGTSSRVHAPGAPALPAPGSTAAAPGVGCAGEVRTLSVLAGAMPSLTMPTLASTTASATVSVLAASLAVPSVSASACAVASVSALAASETEPVFWAPQHQPLARRQLSLELAGCSGSGPAPLSSSLYASSVVAASLLDKPGHIPSNVSFALGPDSGDLVQHRPDSKADISSGDVTRATAYVTGAHKATTLNSVGQCQARGAASDRIAAEALPPVLNTLVFQC